MTGYLNSPPASVVAYLVAGSATTLAIDGITAGDFIMLDAAGTEHVIAGQPVDGALTAALSAEEVDGLLAAGAQRIRVVSDDRVIAAGPVRRRDGWSGDCAQHQMLARVIVGPPGEKGEPGADGRTPVFTWSGTRLEVDGIPGPDLKGEPGRDGADSTVPGPAGPPGAVATPTDYLLVGPGRPDTPDSTGGIITGAEPVGCEYRSTDGASVGAWVWRKRPSGWECVEGDTGWRNIEADLEAALTEQGVTYLGQMAGFPSPQIRRVNDALHLDVGFKWEKPEGASGYPDICTALGCGSLWTRAWTSNRQIPASVTGSAGVIHWAPTVYIRPWAPGNVILTVSTWCAGPWPTTLPGSPA